MLFLWFFITIYKPVTPSSYPARHSSPVLRLTRLAAFSPFRAVHPTAMHLHVYSHCFFTLLSLWQLVKKAGVICLSHPTDNPFYLGSASILAHMLLQPLLTVPSVFMLCFYNTVKTKWEYSENKVRSWPVKFLYSFSSNSFYLPQ